MGLPNYIGSRWFRRIHRDNLIYNQCWEDPRVDRAALDLNGQSKVLMISSAGCNALDYALDSPAKIFAVDVNPRQTALLDLKIAGIRTLDFSTFFQLFGKGRFENIDELYADILRPALPQASRLVWDSSLDYFKAGRRGEGLYYRGTTGLFAAVVNFYLQFKKIRMRALDLFEARNLSEQKEGYERLSRDLWNRTLEATLNSQISINLLGVPQAQRRHLESTFQGSIASFVKSCVEKVFTQIPLTDNYFWWLYLSGSYSRERCPGYLKAENFERLKKGLVDRIETHTCSLMNFLEETPESITHFVLLDHMDWLADSSDDELEREWRVFAERAAIGARFIFRSGGTDARFLDDISVPTAFGEKYLYEVLSYDKPMAARLELGDRVQTYGSFFIADWTCQ